MFSSGETLNTGDFSVLGSAIIALLSLLLVAFWSRQRSIPVAGSTVSKTESVDVVVTKILVHPIKSCKGTSVPECRFTIAGLEYDRRWCIVDANSQKVLTARDIPKMVLIVPSINRDASRLEVAFPADTGCEPFSVPLEPTSVTLNRWSTLSDIFHFSSKGLDGYICQSLDGDTTPSDTLSRFIGRPVHLVMKGPNPRYCDPTYAFPSLPNLSDEDGGSATVVFQDGYPLLVASEESLGAVAQKIRGYAKQGSAGEVKGIVDKWTKTDIEIERFRPNIVVRGAGIPFAEDHWQEIAVGSDVPSEKGDGDASLAADTINGGAHEKPNPGIVLVSPCTRCLLPNVDTQTGIRDAAVPSKVLQKFRAGVDPQNKTKTCFGVNGIPRGDGVVRVGDRVRVLSRYEKDLQL